MARKKYSLLIKLLKQKFTNYKIILLGNDVTRIQHIENADVNLVKKTSFTELKTILKFAFLHVDCECGMVHLREALHGGPSVVLFGPTPVDFFGYPNNINITANACKHWCAGHHFLWQKECFLGNNVCMNSLKPEMVINAITKYQDKLLKSDDYLKTEIYKKTSLDKTWDANWFRNKKIDAYELPEIKISELKIRKMSSEGNWVICNLSESACLDFLNGDQEKYAEYCNLKNRMDTHNDIHSVERFSNLAKNYDNYSNKKIDIVIDKNNVILDGQHRASLIFHKDPSMLIRVLKLYF